MFDTTTLFASLVHAMDHTAWTTRRDKNGVCVASGFPVFAPDAGPVAAEGFLIRADRSDIDLDHGLAYFHDACHFADTANRLTTLSQIIEVSDPPVDRYRAVVRTAFGLPWPLTDREFLHGVATRRDRDEAGRDRVLVAYTTVSDRGLPPTWPGYLRCPMSPSGQRLTDLGGGRVRAEHCMTYELAGSVPVWVQNLLFHRGHVSAYWDEWVLAMDTLAAETLAREALTRGRTA